MFITEQESNYDRVCRDLLVEVERTGARANASFLGGSVEGDSARVPLFGEDCFVRSDGVFKEGRRLDTFGSILAVRYLLQAGTAEIRNSWLPYRDLKNGAQFASYIKAHIEEKLALAFSGRPAVLKARLEALGGLAHTGEMRADLVFVVRPFPRVPVLCIFWDKDEEFAASFQFLFDASAPSYLDMESLAATLQYIYLRLAGEA